MKVTFELVIAKRANIHDVEAHLLAGDDKGKTLSLIRETFKLPQ
jgi:hypothetical protein